ncbi:GNAT family N-acetyltransferase [Streptomyces sp. NPDC000594]|uniref:GNAT family N-acetyltransferase n=1 Tax=Streptomyces sp. NPDC000594 TaxID=3154261 RepID=UPI003325AEEA
MVEVRALDPDDWPLWRGLRLAALAEAPRAFGSTLGDWQGEGDREERWRARLGIPGALDLVALLDGRPVGMASGVPEGPEPGGSGAVELISVWVDPAARGRGVGDRLIQEIETWAAGRGAPLLKLSVRHGNDTALALYTRHGFRDTGEPGALLPDGTGQTVLAKTPVIGGPSPRGLRRADPAA